MQSPQLQFSFFVTDSVHPAGYSLENGGSPVKESSPSQSQWSSSAGVDSPLLGPSFLSRPDEGIVNEKVGTLVDQSGA